MKSLLLFILVLALVTSCQSPVNKDTINLAGDWNFKVDPQSRGITEKWYNTEFSEKIRLPGSMAENGKGEDITVNTKWTGEIVDSSWFKNPDMEKYRQAGNIKVPFWLQPEKYYTGMAWYQRKIMIPDTWKGKNIQLFLERCHWETHVWVDERDAGTNNSLGTPHVYDLTPCFRREHMSDNLCG